MSSRDQDAQPTPEDADRATGRAPGSGPTPRDPRTVSAVDDLGTDTPGDLLDVELDDSPGDQASSDGGSLNGDVRSDSYDDESRERR